MSFIDDAAWFPDDATIKMENKTNGSITTFTTRVTNFSDGGGDRTTESVAHYGGATVVVSQPQEDFTVDFDVTVTDTTWMSVLSGDVTESGSFRMVQSGGTQDDHKVKLEWDSPTTTNRYKILYYNADGVTFTKDGTADGRLTGTLSFTVAPTDSDAKGQKFEMETADDTDAGIGSAITGSFGSYEAHWDSEFGYTVGGML